MFEVYLWFNMKNMDILGNCQKINHLPKAIVPCCEWAQPMRYAVSMKHRPSLTGPIDIMSPALPPWSMWLPLIDAASLTPVYIGIPFLPMKMCFLFQYSIDGLVQDCSNSIANALALLQSCTEPSIYNPQLKKYILPDFPANAFI